MSASRQLPSRANLEHLRNEAKQRLKEMRLQDAAAKLTDAQLVAAREHADPHIIAMLEDAGVTLDLLTAITLRRYDLAERMLREDPARIGPDGRDTIALHLLVANKDTEGVRWLIDHGVDLSAKRVLWDCNSTALHVTTEHDTIELTQMLLDAGADPHIRDDKYNATVLGWADYIGRPDIAALLRDRAAAL